MIITRTKEINACCECLYFSEFEDMGARIPVCDELGKGDMGKGFLKSSCYYSISSKCPFKIKGESNNDR